MSDNQQWFAAGQHGISFARLNPETGELETIDLPQDDKKAVIPAGTLKDGETYILQTTITFTLRFVRIKPTLPMIYRRYMNSLKSNN